MACALAKGPVGRPALAPRCLTRNQALCPSGRPLRGGHSHHGAQSPGSLTLLPSPVLACLTPHPLSVHRWRAFKFQLALRYQLQPPPRLGSHPQLLDSSLSWGPITQLPLSHLLLSQPRSHACHAPILCSISEWAFGVCTPKPAPDLSLLGGSKDSTWVLDSRASA